MHADFDYLPLHGTAISEHIEELGRLRITVFREYPYLYEGTPEEEQDYLSRYAANPRSLVVLMRYEGRLVGATTCQPLADETASFRAPFEKAGFDLEEIFYFGESVILPEFRGQGGGGAFFRFREEHAARTGPFRYTTFCAVDRPSDHPLRPAGYRALDDYWSAKGYRKHPELVCTFPWKDVDQPAPTDHTLTFWMKDHSSS